MNVLKLDLQHAVLVPHVGRQLLLLSEAVPALLAVEPDRERWELLYCQLALSAQSGGCYERTVM